MNLILFEKQLDVLQLDADDPRASHIRDVLKMDVGDELYVGVIDGVRGKAKIVGASAGSLELAVSWESDAPQLHPLTLLVGLPRPQTARAILREGASLGFEKMVFFAAEKGERSYAQSRLWHDGEWQSLLELGAAQAFNTRLPHVTHHDSLVDALQAESLTSSCRMALDLYEAETSLADGDVRLPAVLAIGAERGWSSAERDALKTSEFTFAHLGDRVLRSESACIAAAAILLARGGGLTPGWGQER
jgi:RsmE family RNA methyltransferase